LHESSLVSSVFSNERGELIVQASDAPDPFEAERFELRGEDISVYYVAQQGPRPLRHMTLVDRDGERRFYQGGDIHVDETRPGTMVTVVTQFAFDGDTHLLSIFLPDVNLRDQPTAEITTVAIRTVHKGSIGGPGLIDGALATYEAVALTGTAGSEP
jgi:hypothetical protein